MGGVDASKPSVVLSSAAKTEQNALASSFTLIFSFCFSFLIFNMRKAVLCLSKHDFFSPYLLH